MATDQELFAILKSQTPTMKTQMTEALASALDNPQGFFSHGMMSTPKISSQEFCKLPHDNTSPPITYTSTNSELPFPALVDVAKILGCDMPAPPEHEPKPEIVEKQYFCRKCLKVVQTKKTMDQATWNPTLQDMVTTKVVCAKCNSSVVDYNLLSLAKLLREQDKLVTQALQINNQNVTINRQNQEYQKRITELEHANASVAATSSQVTTEVPELKRRIADLQRQMEEAGITPKATQTGRAKRELSL